MSLERRVVLVTGAASGIGRGMALGFAGTRSIVAVADRNEEGLTAVAQEIAKGGGAASIHALDVADEASVAATLKAIGETHGHLDVLVHCAAINKLRPFLEVSADQWRRIVDVNLTGTFLVAQAAARAMVQRRTGRIVLIASNTGLRGAVDRAAYAASKAGVINLMQTMAIELAPLGITVNAIAPGPTNTPMTGWQPEAIRRALLTEVPLGRYGEIEEIVAGALYLASAEAGYVTAHTLSIDGGFAGAGVIRGSLPEPAQR